MDQYQFVEERLAFYDEQGLTPEPGGEWQEAHYPDPKGVGDRTVWMTFNDHQQQGLYQSEEHGRCCFYNYDTLRFLTHGPFVPGWFDLWDLYDKWKGENGRKTGSGNSDAMNAHPNTKKVQECELLNAHPNTRMVRASNAKAMNSHISTQENRKNTGRMAAEKTSKSVQCVETKSVYPSTCEAARQTGIRQSNISQSCYRGCRAGGYHWEFVGVGG